jgi:hypothetical protein
MNLPEQIQEYLDFCNKRNKALQNGELDLCSCSWFYPTKLLPLSLFIKQNPKIKVCSPKDASVATYLETIKERKSTKGKSYMPIVELPQKEEEAEKTLNELYNLNNYGKEYGGEIAFKYTIGELVDNIYQHSQFKSAFVMAQRYPSKGFLEICFYDDGITIPGSLKKAGLIFNEEEDKAIAEAINGLSAKNNKERGYGLWSNLNLVLNGLKGEFLVVSGNGAVFASKTGQKLFKLQEPHKLKGTLISIRVSCQQKEVNFYEFVEPHND